MVLGGSMLVTMHSVQALSERDVVAAIQQVRDEHDVEIVVERPELMVAARAKLQHMCQEHYWAHVAPDGTTPWKFFHESDYIYRKSGENLAAGYDTSAAVMSAWIASAPHRAALLDTAYQDVGVAVVRCDVGRGIETVVVAHFGVVAQPDIVTVQQPSTRSWFTQVFAGLYLANLR